jgi:hypothetical protein
MKATGNYLLLSKTFTQTATNENYQTLKSLLLLKHRYWSCRAQWYQSYTSLWARSELRTLMMKGTYCTGSCKSNYHTITCTVLFVDAPCTYYILQRRVVHTKLDIYLLITTTGSTPLLVDYSSSMISSDQ